MGGLAEEIVNSKSLFDSNCLLKLKIFFDLLKKVRIIMMAS